MYNNSIGNLDNLNIFFKEREREKKKIKPSTADIFFLCSSAEH
jgi:hypothetical protein